MTIHIGQVRADRGSETVETAILAGVLLVALVSAVQAGLWWHTRSLCHHAAATGLHAARAYAATPSAGRAAAEEFLHRAPHTAADPVITVSGSAAEVSVEVSASAPRLLPLPLDFRVTRTATGPHERFTTTGDAR